MNVIERIQNGVLGRASVVVIAGFAAFVLAQNGCSSSSDGQGATPTQDSGTSSGGGCLAGETLQTLEGTYTCRATDWVVRRGSEMWAVPVEHFAEVYDAADDD